MSDGVKLTEDEKQARAFVDSWPDQVVAEWVRCPKSDCAYCDEVERYRDEKREAMKGKRNG